MDDKVIEITINGTTYWIPADRLNDLQFIDNKLVNVSNSNLTLRHTYDVNTTYPYISCNANSACRYYSSSNVNYQNVTSNYSYTGNFNINTLGNQGVLTYILLFLILILGVKLLWKR